jgi:MFS family permease
MVLLGGVALGAAICGLPYLVYAAEFPPWGMTTIALALASGGLAIVRPTDKWVSGAGVGVGILVPMIATIVLDYRRDPTSHNLLPLEILIGLALGMPPALFGALLGGLTARVRFRRALVGGTIAALGLAVAAVHAPVILARTVASESDALAKVKSLIAAEDRFRSANPTRGFSCDLNELGERLDSPPRRLVSGSRRVAGEYGAGTYAPAGDYDFSLQCGNELKPMTSYLLMAAPRQRGFGRRIFCAEAAGRLLEAKRHRNNFCRKEGLPVPD